jgi:hypothetical protein
MALKWAWLALRRILKRGEDTANNSLQSLEMPVAAAAAAADSLEAAARCR